MNYQSYFYVASILGIILCGVNMYLHYTCNKIKRKKNLLDEAFVDYMDICDKQLEKIELLKANKIKLSAKVASLSHSLKAKDRKIGTLAESEKYYKGKMNYRDDIIDSERAKHR